MYKLLFGLLLVSSLLFGCKDKPKNTVTVEFNLGDNRTIVNPHIVAINGVPISPTIELK